MAKKIAISVRGVTKHFLLPHERVGSIKTAFTSVFKRRARRTIEVQQTLRGVSLEVKEGEFFGVVGKNGSGKSTLLKILAGIYRPTGGHVETHGSLVPFIELGVGFNPELTGRENVYLNGALLGFSKAQIDAKYNQIVQFAELENFMDQRLKNYSSGMQVRLAFSMAVQAESDILIIDEVLAVGDAAFQRKCFNYFMDLKRRKKTVVLVTHDMEAVRQYCDRAILIKDGLITAEGDPEKVAQEYIKQFMPTEEEVAEDAFNQGDRWGDGRASFSRPRITIDDDFVRINTTLRVKENLQDVLVGMSVANSSGQRLIGTNNSLCRQELPTLRADTKLRIEWKIPNIFTTGDYKIDIAAETKGGVAPLDWWNEAADMVIQKTHPTPYVVYPKFDLTLSEEV